LKTLSGRRPGWKAFTYRHVSEFKVQPLHRGM
jgi:hypothetical protein